MRMSLLRVYAGMKRGFQFVGLRSQELSVFDEICNL